MIVGPHATTYLPPLAVVAAVVCIAVDPGGKLLPAVAEMRHVFGASFDARDIATEHRWQSLTHQLEDG
jgi:hypothetical protein